jgi:hypothetical protein
MKSVSQAHTGHWQNYDGFIDTAETTQVLLGNPMNIRGSLVYSATVLQGSGEWVDANQGKVRPQRLQNESYPSRCSIDCQHHPSLRPHTALLAHINQNKNRRITQRRSKNVKYRAIKKLIIIIIIIISQSSFNNATKRCTGDETFPP